MKLNNHVDRSNLVSFLMEMFPLVASLLEFGEALLKTVEMSSVHATVIHIPIHFVGEVVGLTTLQYAFAIVIACFCKWSKHSVNVVLELALLVYCVLL